MYFKYFSFRTNISILLTIAAASGIFSGCFFCGASSTHDQRESSVLDLAPALEIRRAYYQKNIKEAIFAVQHRFSSWGYGSPPAGYFKKAVVFQSFSEAKRTLAAAFGTDSAAIPASFAGTVSDTTLYVVSEPMYKAIWERMYPGWEWRGEETYRSLLIHEIAHSEHAYIARTHWGSEDAMGPEWFYEGLAMACAGQFPLGEHGQVLLTDQEVRSAAADTTSTIKYPRYSQMVQSLLKRYPASALIEHAKDNSIDRLLEASERR